MSIKEITRILEKCMLSVFISSEEKGRIKIQIRNLQKIEETEKRLCDRPAA